MEAKRIYRCETRKDIMNNMKVVSLFDGMSCGQLALKKAGLHYDTYLASEIKKDAIKVTQENFP